MTQIRDPNSENKIQNDIDVFQKQIRRDHNQSCYVFLQEKILARIGLKFLNYFFLQFLLFDELLENVFIEFQLLQILQCRILLLLFNNSDPSRAAYFKKKLFRLFRHLNTQAVG